jgi:hypothetical protein
MHKLHSPMHVRVSFYHYRARPHACNLAIAAAERGLAMERERYARKDGPGFPPMSRLPWPATFTKTNSASIASWIRGIWPLQLARLCRPEDSGLSAEIAVLTLPLQTKAMHFHPHTAARHM